VSNGEAGVFITTGAKKNLIGSGAAGGGNLISGNTYVGIQIDSSGTIDNRVQGNTIGVNATGTTAVGNGEAGIMILKEAQQNIVGGDTPGTGNLISGNQVGVALVATATANLVQGNKIGSNLTGLARLGNMTGILLTNGATNNLIGGETAGARNLISGNNGVGIQLQSSGTSGNMIRGNYIGTNLMGTAALSNTSGVVIGFKAANNVVTGNLISGNSTQGILISDANFNQVRGNSIGLNAAGQSPLGNGSYGVYLSNGAQSNIIGISNTIVYNGAAGVALSGSTTLRNTITRNIIHSNTSLPIDYLDQPEPISPIEIFYTPQPFVISGTVCAGCTLEVFVNPDETLAGTLYLGQTTAANNGAYSFTWSNPPYPYPALTVTDKKGTTSEFYSDKVSPPRSPAAAVYLPLIVK
jgi:titin